MKKTRMKVLAYTAGIIDGEGSINILRQRNMKPVGNEWYYRLRICVKMCDGKVIDYLYGNFGGLIMHRPQSEPNHSDQYEWTLSGTKAADLLKDLIPFLAGKKEQAELGVRFQIHRKQGRKVNYEFDQKCAEHMKFLHKNYHTCAAVETKQSASLQEKL